MSYGMSVRISGDGIGSVGCGGGGADGVNENKIPTIRIYRRGPVDDVEHAAEGGEEGGLAAPGAAADSYTLPPRDGDGGPPPPRMDGRRGWDENQDGDQNHDGFYILKNIGK